MGTATRIRLRSPFLQTVLKSGLLKTDALSTAFASNKPEHVASAAPMQLATLLVRKRLLTKFQAMQLLNGKTQGFVLGGYTITGGIRQDRVGMVFRAERAGTREEVAVKVLPTDRVSDNTVFRPFLEEARRAARINSEAVVRVFEVGEWCGTHYAVCELVEAPTLDKVVAQGGPLPPHTAAQVIAQTAVALMSGHAAGLVHRDIKPANIALLAGNRVKLIDFGLTHLIDNPWANATKRINLNEYRDEVAHIAPEQAWGGELDARSDIYSLGSTAYFLLTGSNPFPASAMESMTARQLCDVPKPSALNPAVPAELDEIVQKMGAKDPHRRFQTAEELVAAMLPWLPIDDWNRLGVPVAPARERRPQGERPITRPGLRERLGSMFGRFFRR